MQAKKKFSLRKFGKSGFDIIKRATSNLIKDYTITQIVVPFLQLKLGGLTSKILIITIIAFIQKAPLKNCDSDFYR